MRALLAPLWLVRLLLLFALSVFFWVMWLPIDAFMLVLRRLGWYKVELEEDE